MVQISEAARSVLLNNLVDACVPPETGYRLAMHGQGYKLRLDRPSKHDRVVSIEEQVVFMVEPEVDRVLEDVVLDLKDGDSERMTLQLL